MLTIGGRSGLGTSNQLTGPPRPARVQPVSRLCSNVPQTAAPRTSAPSVDCGAAFQVHKLLAHPVERGAPFPRREVMLAAYHVHLARRIRYFGPLTPVDLRV